MLRYFLYIVVATVFIKPQMLHASQVTVVSVQQKPTWHEKKMLNEAQTSTLTEKRLEEFIQHGANVNIQNQHGWTPLMYAARYGQINLVKALIKAGAKLDIQSNGKWTALMWAAYWGHLDVVNMLIKAGANLDLQNDGGMTAAMYAVQGGYFDILDALAKGGADLTIQNNECFQASELNQRVNPVEEMMKAAAHTKKQKAEKRVLEMFAAVLCGNVIALKSILQAGVDINAQFQGTAALWMAIEKNDANIVSVLLSAGANFAYADILGVTPLMWASIKGNVAIVNLLIQAGADSNAQDISGFTALLFAAIHGRKNVIIALLNAGANPYIISFDAQSIRDNYLKTGRHGSQAESWDIQYAHKTFDSILAEKHPELSADPEIQKALVDYDERVKKEKARIAYSRAIVAPEIVKNLTEVPFPRDLANMVAEYAVEEVPPVVKEAEEKKQVDISSVQEEEKQKTASCCIIQ